VKRTEQQSNKVTKVTKYNIENMVDIKNLKKFIMQQFVGQVIPIVNHSI
jgi:hypothetical protein